MQDKTDAAYAAIRFFHGDQYDVYLEFDAIYENISRTSHGQSTWK